MGIEGYWRLEANRANKTAAKVSKLSQKNIPINAPVSAGNLSSLANHSGLNGDIEEDDEDVFGVATFSSISAQKRMTLSRLLRSLRPSEYNALVQSLIINRDYKSREGSRYRSKQRSNSHMLDNNNNHRPSDIDIDGGTIESNSNSGSNSSNSSPNARNATATSASDSGRANHNAVTFSSLSPAMRSAVMQQHNIQLKYDNVLTL